MCGEIMQLLWQKYDAYAFCFQTNSVGEEHYIILLAVVTRRIYTLYILFYNVLSLRDDSITVCI